MPDTHVLVPYIDNQTAYIIPDAFSENRYIAEITQFPQG